MNIKALAPLALVVGLAACAPQTIIANNRQAVIESWTASDAVAMAEKECGARGRWPTLLRQSGSEYWFSCNETEEAIAARLKAAEDAAMKRAEEMKKAMAAVTQAPAMAAPTAMPAPAPAEEAKSAVAAMSAQQKGYWVQVGAFKNRQAGEQFLAAIRKAHARTVKGHDLILREAELSGRGTYHLARLGPYPRSGTARRACNAIKARGAACFVIRQR